MTPSREPDGRDARELARATARARHELETRAGQEADQSAADLDQTQADADQTASEADQQASDADQALADRDQHASDRDQAAADWERTHAPADPAAIEAHESSRLERHEATRDRELTAAGRARATAQRIETATHRDDIARLRDLTAEARDRLARARDDAAAARDRDAEVREQRAAESGTIDDAMLVLQQVRRAAAEARQRAADERAAAAADRRAAADDREHAASDRRLGGLDELTGVFRRGVGELALKHEIDRARRLGRRFVLAVLDVDELKDVNDRAGHAAGDALLRDVAIAITSTLRSYDITVRWGGDEFVCAMSDVTLELAAERIAEIQRTLDARSPAASISAGQAALRDDDTLDTVIARADAELYLAKRRSGR
jgi:diguanylate cyclase (GGDEF)-like protein